MFHLTFNPTSMMKKGFFDREKVIKELDRGTHKAMSRTLAFIRQAAKRILKRRKAVSLPGSPPSHRASDPAASLKNILFAYDRRTKSGIVGPVRLNQRNQDAVSRGNVTVPELHEFGGAVNIHEAVLGWVLRRDGEKAWRRRDLRRNRRPGEIRRTRTATYMKRPFMRPALDQEIKAGNVMTPWTNVVNG